MRSTTRLSTGLAAGAVLVLGLSACGSDSGAAPTGTSAGATSGSATKDSSAPSSTAAEKTGSAAATSSASGADDLDPKKVLETTTASVKGAETVSLKITNKESKNGATATVSGRVDGTNQRGVYDFGPNGTTELRIVSGTQYLKGDAKYWKAQSSQAGTKGADLSKLADKWITVPKSEQQNFKGEGLDQILVGMEGLMDPKTATPDNSTVTRGQHEGKPAIIVERRAESPSGSSSKTKKPADDKTELTVADDDEQLPLQLTKAADVATFSDWNAVDPVSKPSGPTAEWPTP